MEMTPRLYGTVESPALWLDHWAYTEQLLLDGQPIPWFDATAFDSFFRKAHGLLDPEVVVLPVERLWREHVASSPELRDAMAEKKRSAYPAKAFLKDDQLRSRVRRCVELVTSAAPRAPLVLSVPSPRGLIAWAFHTAHDESLEDVDADLADSGAMYLSEFFSPLSDCAVAAVMVEEASSEPDVAAASLLAYAPLRNVCSHLRWELGLRFEGALGATEPFDFVVAKKPLVGANEPRVGAWLPDGLWRSKGAPARPEGTFLYAQVPHDANPETVLKRRDSLRTV